MIESIERIRESYTDDVFISGSVDLSQIREAESRLGLIFPTEYNSFLHDYGSLTFFGMEVLGIIYGQLSSGTKTDCVQVTEFYRAGSGLPDNLIVIFDDNGDELHVIRIDEKGYDISSWNVIEKSFSRIISATLVEYISERIEDAEEALANPDF